MKFKFKEYESEVHITDKLPDMAVIASVMNCPDEPSILIVCDEHTKPLAVKISGGKRRATGLCVLKSGEENKTWRSAEKILDAAKKAGIGRDGAFLGIGGGMVTDLCAFAASIYMRGTPLALVCTTLLCMVDAGLGGKNGIDLFGIKNLAGTFYPASHVYMPIESLEALPEREWKNGYAELIKTAILAGGEFWEEIVAISNNIQDSPDTKREFFSPSSPVLLGLVNKAVQFKGLIAGEDPADSGKRRILNLGHTFAHALEASLGFGKIAHGEAVAWGIARSCELGVLLGVTPPLRAKEICGTISRFGFTDTSRHMDNKENFLNALCLDKKKKAEGIVFLVPDEKSARAVLLKNGDVPETIGKIIGSIGNK